MTETFRMPPTECPTCHHKLDAASSFDGSLPDPGDCSLCMYCGNFMILEPDDSLRPPTEEERLELEADPEVQRIVSVVKAFAAGLAR